jgi:peptide/nickel transport system permease protein
MSEPEPAYGLSPFARGLRRLRRNRPAMACAWLLVLLYASAGLAGLLSPYHYDDERRDLSYHPPTSIHMIDAQGYWHKPFVYATRGEFDPFYRRRFIEDASHRYPLRLWVRGSPYRILGVIRSDVHLIGADAPARIYLMGADSRGRDLFSRLLHGGQVSLTIGLAGVLISFSLGLIIGGMAGFFGGWVDELTMRVCEMLMMAPGFYLLLALRAAFPPQLSSVAVYILIVVILSFIGWAGLARVVRGMAVSLRERQFITAARLAGRSPLGIVAEHFIPNMASYAIVAATLSVPGYIMGESALSLLGLGIQDPYASWGNLLSDAMGIAQVQFHPWVLWPGVFIALTVMAYNVLGDGLRDAFDPRLEPDRQ